MLSPPTSPAAPSLREIDHLVDGVPHWYPAGHPTDGDWQIPVVPAPTIDSIPTTSRAYDKRHRVPRPADTILHGYLVDRKLRTHARDPGPWVTRFDPFWGVVAPDFSIWLDQPPDRKVFAVRMSRAVGVFHALRGINVIPTLRWGTVGTTTLPSSVSRPARQSRCRTTDCGGTRFYGRHSSTACPRWSSGSLPRRYSFTARPITPRLANLAEEPRLSGFFPTALGSEWNAASGRASRRQLFGCRQRSRAVQ